MSREIKFRAWDKKNGYYADYEDIEEEITAQAIDGWRSKDGGTSFTLDYGIKQFELEQYTGLKDKNGKEIYEGDVVKYLSYRKDCIGQVVFDFVDDSEGYYIEKHYGWGIYRDGYNTSLGDYADDNMRCELVEVIGNIHENPKLLEDK